MGRKADRIGVQVSVMIDEWSRYVLEVERQCEMQYVPNFDLVTSGLFKGDNGNIPTIFRMLPMICRGSNWNRSSQVT